MVKVPVAYTTLFRSPPCPVHGERHSTNILRQPARRPHRLPPVARDARGCGGSGPGTDLPSPHRVTLRKPDRASPLSLGRRGVRESGRRDLWDRPARPLGPRIPAPCVGGEWSHRRRHRHSHSGGRGSQDAGALRSGRRGGRKRTLSQDSVHPRALCRFIVGGRSHPGGSLAAAEGGQGIRP